MPADRPLVGVLALQGDVREHLEILERSGATPLAVRRPAELASVDALVIPGGESTTIVKLAGVFDLIEPIRERLAAGMPALGTCAGMILLADRLLDGTEQQGTFGGIDVVVRRNAFGRQVDSFETEVAFASYDEPMHAVFIRAPWVEKAGDDVEVLARVVSGRVPGRIVAVRQGRLMATSFHPEITGDPRAHRYFVDLVIQT
jgi:5'-phosphate synthase pdxT subunit